MALQSEDDGACGDIAFDPLVLPAGIAPSDDPLLPARSAAYMRSFTRRESETKAPSAVRPETGG
jgi:catalase